MVSSELWFGASADFYNGVATQSLRFNDDDSPYMEFDPASATAGTWTMSFWVKRTTLGVAQAIFSSGIVNARGHVSFTSDDQFQLQPFNSSGQAGYTYTDMKFRDTSAWYHIVVSANGITTSNIATNLIFYVNGVVATRSFNSGSSATGGDRIGDAQAKRIGEFRPDSGSHFDGYLCDFNFVDGIVKDQNDFGEFKNGVWIAKEPDVSDYGAGGWRLKFIGTGTSTSSGAVANPTNIGDDSSGKNNHWSVSGLASTDANLPDSPENNMCTLNPLARLNRGANSAGTYSEGNLKIVHAGSSNQVHAYGTNRINDFLTDGCYFEIRATSVDASRFYVGIVDPLSASASAIASYGFANKAMVNTINENFSTTNTAGANAGTPSTALSISANDIIGFAIKGTSLWFHVNGTYSRDLSNNLGNPSTGANAFVTAITDIANKDYFPYAGYASSFVFNFGQDPSFAGGLTGADIGTETPDAGAGVFKYPVPTGFKALCSANISDNDLPISPNANTQAVNHFGNLTYTGNGIDSTSTNNIRSGGAGVVGEIDFQPDFTWIKSRASTNNHNLFDSNRGAGIVLYSQLKLNEADTSAYFTDFAVNGFNLAQNGGDTNFNNYTYVAWNWLANGTTPSKTYKVVVVSDSGNKYRFRNSADDATFAQSAVTLNLQELGTYTFDLSDSSMSGHPFVFSTTSDGTHGGGSEYTTGVTKTGTAGSAGASIVITVASSAPTLYYYCSNHSGMGGQINTNETHGSTNFDGNILSVSNANTIAGFSVITYTGQNAATTIGHGLGKKPAMIIVKQRTDDNTDWIIGHKEFATNAFANNKFFKFDSTAEIFTNSAVFGAEPDTTEIQLTTTTAGNLSSASKDFVAYCFAEIEGYSKFGSYNGNSASDGAFVYTGFRPAFVMIRRTTGAASNWLIMDNARSPTNIGATANCLAADSALTESSISTRGIDFVSNGFKIRTTAADMNTGDKLIYMAFAEQPFKYANAR